MPGIPLTEKLTETSQYLYRKGLAPGKSGNISARSNEVVAITPSGVSLKDVSAEKVVMVDFGGNVLVGSGMPSSELLLHLRVYQTRNDIKGIVHTHSPYATGFALSGEHVNRLEGFGKVLRPYLKMIEYAQPGTKKLANLVSEGLKDEDLVLLKGHGVVTTGPSIDQASILAEFVEEIAKIQFVTHLLSKNVKD
ncbi:MAG: class II aldolase/adducin family protein [Methanobacteriaceae archaeon]